MSDQGESGSNLASKGVEHPCRGWEKGAGKKTERLEVELSLLANEGGWPPVNQQGVGGHARGRGKSQIKKKKKKKAHGDGRSVVVCFREGCR